MDAEPLPPDRFLDRELSWLAFNQRVLELAQDASVPLLERAKFLAIYASNLDEFYMVRVAGLKRRIATGIAVRAASGGLPREVHDAILARTRVQMAEHARCFGDEVRPALAKEGIEILRWDELTAQEQADSGRFFDERIFPVLTPLAVDPAHPFPYISGLSLNLAVVVRNPTTGHRALRAGQGAAEPVRGSTRSPCSGSCRSRRSSRRTWTRSSPAWRCCSTTASG